MTLTLYDYARSSAAFRVRIALNLKGLDYAREDILLRAEQQTSQEYLAVNPQGLVPALVDGETVLTQSLAIMDYLEEIHPEPPILPADAAERARVRALSQIVACEIHPLNNLRVRRYLADNLGLDEAASSTWYKHWMAKGLSSFEAMLDNARATAAFCHGDRPTLADICLVPQVFNAKLYDCPLDDYPTLMRIFGNCMALSAFDQAQPDKQGAP